jgi:hypothetical protein
MLAKVRGVGWFIWITYSSKMEVKAKVGQIYSTSTCLKELRED